MIAFLRIVYQSIGKYGLNWENMVPEFTLYDNFQQEREMDKINSER